MNKILSSVLVAGALALTAVSASAASISVNRSGSATSGTVHYNGDGGALYADNIGFNTIDLPGGSGLECRGCKLSFNTGNLIRQSGDVYTFGSGGSFSLIGRLYEGSHRVGLGQQVAFGSFTGNPLLVSHGATGFSLLASGQSFGAYGSLFSYYDSIAGTSTAQSLVGFGSTIASTNGNDIFDDDGSFRGHVTGARLSYTVADPATNDVPEPNDIALLGGSLLLIGLGVGFRRRKMPLIG